MPQITETCRKCRGTGSIGKAKDLCPKCKGTGQFVKEDSTLAEGAMTRN